MPKDDHTIFIAKKSGCREGPTKAARGRFGRFNLEPRRLAITPKTKEKQSRTPESVPMALLQLVLAQKEALQMALVQESSLSYSSWILDISIAGD
jgi:hypothetical protein